MLFIPRAFWSFDGYNQLSVTRILCTYYIKRMSYFQNPFVAFNCHGVFQFRHCYCTKNYLPGYPKLTRDNETKIQQWNIWGKKLDVKTIIYCTTINSFNKTDINFLLQFWNKWWCKCCRRQFNSSQRFQINLSFWNNDHAKKCNIRN